ncbi:hypothetical protein SLEP1_g34639 [Rubroshorea leprosula]|uniref:RING-type E3 ubiquitin transferase n=1 Tax=Rubroshorea leprosula TaxID=152421 RepID=A0AAV5KKM1_9ROSI|nr:hypothetical protein SLEP1_g34639 [Rubroshorea leprosula]
MASVSYLQRQRQDADEDAVHHRSHPIQSLTLDSLPYWSQEFHFFSSDPDFASHDEFSFPDALIAEGPDPFDDRENQVNFVIDLFHQRVEQSQVMSNSTNANHDNNDDGDVNDNSNNDSDSNAVDLVSDALTELGFGVIDGTLELDMDDLELDLGLGFSSVEIQEDGNSGFVFDTIGGSVVEIDVGGDDDDFFEERRVSALETSGAASTVSVVEPYRESVHLVGFEFDSEDDDNENDNGALAIDLNSGDEYGLDRVDDYDEDEDDVSVTIPLCLDSMQLEDRGETNEDEWEEVDADEREVFSVHYDDENSVSLSFSPVMAQEDAVERASGIGNFGWQVLLHNLHSNNLETNPEMDDNADPYFGDQDDYIHTSEYEMLFGQFVENENAFLGRPPASKSVVENLPSVVVTKEDVECNNALCAVCKDDINIGEMVKQLPCAHRYHGDCIVPWLGIRNTCPVCRHELPTDDSEYERRRSQRAGRAL